MTKEKQTQIEDLVKRLDNIYGILNIHVIRDICESIMVSLTGSMLEINNYTLIVVKKRGRKLDTVQERIEFLEESLQDSVWKNSFDIILKHAPEKIFFDIYDRTFHKSSNEERIWFNKHYIVIGAPIWPIMIHNDAVKSKYNIDISEDELENYEEKFTSDRARINRTKNLFNDLSQNSLRSVAKNLLSMSEDIASCFKSSLLYFGSIPAHFSSKEEENRAYGHNDGFAHIDEKSIDNLHFKLIILEKTPNVVSLYEWEYYTQDIIDLLTGKYKKNREIIQTRIRSEVLSYPEVALFVKQFNL